MKQVEEYRAKLEPLLINSSQIPKFNAHHASHSEQHHASSGTSTAFGSGSHGSGSGSGSSNGGSTTSSPGGGLSRKPSYTKKPTRTLNMRLVPELYIVPRHLIDAEKKNPGSQDRIPNENVPLVWAQSLYILGNLVYEGLIGPADLDPLGRRNHVKMVKYQRQGGSSGLMMLNAALGRGAMMAASMGFGSGGGSSALSAASAAYGGVDKSGGIGGGRGGPFEYSQSVADVVVQVVLLAESAELQAKLAMFGLDTQTVENCAPITISPPAALRDALVALGENEKLGLTGRPKRPIGTLSTCKLFRCQGRLYAFLPHFMDREEFYLVSDNDYLVSVFEQELAFVKKN
ncbi:hypothetical protein HK102_010320, partial [Quaeritorhiza haematococci]